MYGLSRSRFRGLTTDNRLCRMPRCSISRTLARLGTQGQVHLLLAYAPLPKIQQLYTIVFENVLNEKVSTLPVVMK